jgi:CRISPR-associated protein Csm3
MAMTLTKYRNISGTLTCETGLRIGGSTESIQIGGMDNPIIRHPVTDQPYIPGSSLKGKVRSLLEYKHGRRQRSGQPKGEGRRDNGEPCECGQCMICRVFGPHRNPKHTLGPTRALFRDATLTKESLTWLEDAGTGYAEVKTENMVNRLTGTAEHPRTQERVPAGAKFEFEISVRIFDDDDEAEIIGFVEEGLALLEEDYLGASGSRGYGKVSLEYEVE